MYCKNCNNEIKETSKFCQFCGTAVATDTAKPFPKTEAVSYNNTAEKPFPKTEAVSQPEAPAPMAAPTPMAAPAPEVQKEEKPFPKTEAVSQPEAPAPVAAPTPMVAPTPEVQKEEFSDKTEMLSIPETPAPVTTDTPQETEEDSFPKTIAYNYANKNKTTAEKNNGAPVPPVPMVAPQDNSAPATSAPVAAPQDNSTPVTPVQPDTVPPQFDRFAAESEQPVTPKKKNKALPVIIISSVVILASVFCLCFFCFRADIMHAFMGDAKYAKSVTNSITNSVKKEDTSVSLFNNVYTAVKDFDSEAPDGCKEYVESMTEKYGEISTDYENFYYTAAIFRIMGQALNEQLPEGGSSVNSSFNFKLSDDILETITENSGISESDLTEIIDYINLISFDAAIKSDESSVQISSGVNGAKGDFADMALYYGKDGEAYITLGGLSEKAIYLPLPSFETIDEDLADSDDASENEEELKAYFAEMYEAFLNSYDDAKITYEKGKRKAGKIEFEGKVVTIKFDNETLSDLFNEFYEITSDNDTVCELFGDDFADSFKNASESVKDLDDAECIIEYYVNSMNRLLGGKLSVVDENRKASVTILASKDGIAATFETESDDNDDEEISFKFECSFEGKDKGVMTFEFPLSKYDYQAGETVNTNNKVTVKFSDLKEVTAFGQKYTTGHFEASIDFEYFDYTSKATIGQEEVTLGEFLRETVINVDITEKDNGISYTAGLKNDILGEYSATVSYATIESDITPVDYSDADVIDIFAQEDNNTANTDLVIDILDNLVAKIEEDEKLNTALTIGDNSVLDALKGARDEFKAEKEFKDKDFSGNWTTTKINDYDIENYAENNNLYSWEFASNLTFAGDTLTITNNNGSKTYSIVKGNQCFTVNEGDYYMTTLYYDAGTNTFSYTMYDEILDSYPIYTIAEGTQDVTMPEGFVDTRDKGKVLNIMCWNTELQGYFTDYYPGYEYIDYYEGRIGDVTVNWIIKDRFAYDYSSELEDALKYTYYDDDKIDLFLIEPDYGETFLDSDYVLPVSEIGITDADTANMYDYTIQMGSDSNGQLKGISYLTTPGVFAYRRSIAKEVLGTDNPEQVQAMISSSWFNFINIAKKMKDNGYYMISSYDQLIRPCLQEYDMPLVSDDGTLTLSDGMSNWIDVCEQLSEYGCCKDKFDIWSFSYNGDQVFGILLPNWNLYSYMFPDNSSGDWAICEAPSAYYYGNTLLCAANGTDNPNLVANIMRTFTSDEAMIQALVEGEDYMVFSNNKNVNQKLADSYNGNEFFDGQNTLKVFHSIAEKINVASVTIYDSDLIYYMNNAFYDYFTGSTTFSAALVEYYNDVIYQYPELH